LTEAIGLVEEAGGRPQFLLNGVGSLPEATLLAMRPVVHREASIAVEGGWLLASGRPGAPFVRLRPLTAPQAFVLGCFDGRRTVADICSLAQAELGLSPEAALGLVKPLFAALARDGLCHPLEMPC
jgi:hypothetical protein